MKRLLKKFLKPSSPIEVSDNIQVYTIEDRINRANNLLVKQEAAYRDLYWQTPSGKIANFTFTEGPKVKARLKSKDPYLQLLLEETEDLYLDRIEARLNQLRNFVHNINNALNTAARAIANGAKQVTYFLPGIGNIVLGADVLALIANGDYEGVAFTLATIGGMKLSGKVLKNLMENGKIINSSVSAKMKYPYSKKYMYSNNGSGASDNIIQKGYQLGKNDLLNLFTSDDYYNTLKQAGYTDEEALAHIEKFGNNANTASFHFENLNTANSRVGGGYDPITHRVIANRRELPNAEIARQTGAHEYGHASTKGIEGTFTGKSDDVWEPIIGLDYVERADNLPSGTLKYEASAAEWNKNLVDLSNPNNLNPNFRRIITEGGELPEKIFYNIGKDANGKLVLNDEAFTRARSTRARANAEGINPEDAWRLDIGDNNDLAEILSPIAHKKLVRNVLGLTLPITIGGYASSGL